jgi:hypothetical protein
MQLQPPAAAEPAAFATKPVLSEVEGLDLAIAHRAWELRTGTACMAALAHDAQRLS